MLIGLLAAVAAAVLQGAASSLQARGAVTAKRAAALSPLYLFGVILDGLGWVVSLAAVTTMPLLVVEPILAGSLVVTVLLNTWLLRRAPTPLGWGAAALIIASAAILAFAGEPAVSHPAGAALLVALAASAVVVAVLVLVGYRRGWALPMAALGGLGFAGSSVAARGLAFDGWRLLTQGDLWLVVAFGLLGTVAFARGLERAGSEGATGATAWMWVIEISVPSVIGVLALGDTLRPGWGFAAAAALPAVLVGAVLISQPTATIALSQRPDAN